MASQSATPPGSGEDNPQNQPLGVVQLAVEEQQNKAEAAKENSATAVFVNSEPMREEQVQNAVKFLSHPKVRGSPVIYRRSFLERKGLTKEEIDEAFRRVPDPPPTVSNTKPAVTSQDGQSMSSSVIQSQTPNPALQPGAAAPTGAISKAGMFSQFHWKHVFLAASLLAVSGAGTAILLKITFIPRLKSWIRKVALEEEEDKDLVEKAKSNPSPAEEAAVAAKAAAAAAADVARASQEILISKTEEKRCFEELKNLLELQVREMKSMSSAIYTLEGQCYSNGRIPPVGQEDRKVAVTTSGKFYANGKADPDSRSARSASPPSSAEPSVAPHPKSYMEIMAMVQRGEKPPNIREINDLPPNPNQPVSNPRIAPRLKPWVVGQIPDNSTYDLQSQGGNDGLGFKLEDDGFPSQRNGDISEPWWQQKNVRITEIEAEDEQKKTGSSGVLMNGQPAQRTWVPPQPPPVAMAEAAEAIRQPKKTFVQTEHLTDDQLLAHSSDVKDELQRITKITGSGGSLEANGGSSDLNTSEIQNQNGSHLEN